MKAILAVALLANATLLTSAQKAEIRKVDERLLAPCCYTQSIAAHGSEIAREMRAEVAQLVAEGRTEEEIVNRYRTLYGDRILIVPDGVTGRILFSLPVVVAVLASAILLVFIRKMLRSGKRSFAIASTQEFSTLSALRERIEREIGDPL